MTKFIGDFTCSNWIRYCALYVLELKVCKKGNREVEEINFFFACFMSLQLLLLSKLRLHSRLHLLST